jgi:hypothetical protein
VALSAELTLEHLAGLFHTPLGQMCGKSHDEEGRTHLVAHPHEAPGDLAYDIIDPRPLLALAADGDRGSYPELPVVEKRMNTYEIKSTVWTIR